MCSAGEYGGHRRGWSEPQVLYYAVPFSLGKNRWPFRWLWTHCRLKEISNGGEKENKNVCMYRWVYADIFDVFCFCWLVFQCCCNHKRLCYEYYWMLCGIMCLSYMYIICREHHNSLDSDTFFVILVLVTIREGKMKGKVKGEGPRCTQEWKWKGFIRGRQNHSHKQVGSVHEKSNKGAIQRQSGRVHRIGSKLGSQYMETCKKTRTKTHGNWILQGGGVTERQNNDWIKSKQK